MDTWANIHVKYRRTSSGGIGIGIAVEGKEGAGALGTKSANSSIRSTAGGRVRQRVLGGEYFKWEATGLGAK